MAARLVNQLPDFILGMAVAVDQLLIALRLLERVQVLALNILDQRQLGHGRFVDLADNRGDRSGGARVGPRASAARPRRSEILAIGAKQDRLEHAALRNRFGELVERLLVKLDARLAGVGPDPRDLDLAHSAARRRVRGRGRVRLFAQKRGKAAAQTRRLAHAATASCGKRPITSRARRM